MTVNATCCSSVTTTTRKDQSSTRLVCLILLMRQKARHLKLWLIETVIGMTFWTWTPGSLVLVPVSLTGSNHAQRLPPNSQRALDRVRHNRRGVHVLGRDDVLDLAVFVGVGIRMKMERNGTISPSWLAHEPMGAWRRTQRDYVKCSKERAIEIGQITYWTGIPCVRGHKTFRYLSGDCIDCSQARRRERNYGDQKKTSLLKIDRLADQPDLEDDYGL